MADFEYRDLAVDLDRDVCRIAFDRPEELNAITERMHTELSTVFRDVADADARVVVLTGNGEVFSAGGDLEWLSACLDDPENFRTIVREGERTVRDLLAVDKPVIAKINGDATGFAATLALFADVTIASTDARIGDPHVNAGLAAGDGGAVIWPLLVGMNTAKELLLTGELLDAERAAEIGLINRAVPPEDLDDEVAALVDRLANGPQVAIRYTKRALNTWLELGVDAVLRQSLALEAMSQRHPDHREGLAAFREGRRPEFPSSRADNE
jgi:enoyl-CoA hydratase